MSLLPYIVFFQETWLNPSVDIQYDPDPAIPAGFATIQSFRPDPQGQIRGRGLMIVVHPEIIKLLSPSRGPQANLTLLDHITTASFEILAARIGTIFLASIYIKHTPHPPHYDHLMEVLADLCPRMCKQMILGGDFNYPQYWRQCHDLFQERLGVSTVVTEKAGIDSTHIGGNVLDHILISDGLGVGVVSATRMPDNITDHYLISLTLTLTVNPNPNLDPNLISLPNLSNDRFSVSKLKQHRKLISRIARQRKRGKEPSEETRAMWERVEKKEGEIQEGVDRVVVAMPEDLAALNQGLLEVGFSAFPSSGAQPGVQRAYMYKRSVRKKQQARRKCEKDLNRARQRHRPQDMETALAAFGKADKEWEDARRKAQQDQWSDFMTEIINGNFEIFYVMYQRTRMKKPQRTPITHLDPDATTEFFRRLYASPETAAIIASTIPAYQPWERDATEVSIKEVLRAIKQTKNKCGGPDGVPPEFFKHCMPAIKDLLAELITKCLREGIPEALRHGRITLLAKTTPPSKNPAKYRPITLLPAIVRIVLRVLDNKLRDLIKVKVIEIPYEQGGFMPNRNTHLQAFLLLLQRDYARHKKKAMYVAFLDIQKAFDAIDHRQLLEVLRKIGIPEALINALHRLLPFFSLEVMGVLFPQEIGTFQGSPLSPFLCVLFLVDLILYVNGDEGSAFHGMELPWERTSELFMIILKLLLFADDIALMATSIEQLQLALDLMAVWAEKRGIKWGHDKCKVLRISRAPNDKTKREELEEVHLQGHILDWVSDFKYLGVVIMEAPEYRHRLATHIPLDKDKCRALCFGLLRMFPSTARCTRVAPLAARLGVLQVIHAKYLYPTPLLDTDYKALDTQTNRCLRILCGLPLATPSAQIHADLGVWPSRYYAHQRALMFLYKLRWCHWTKKAFQQWYDDSPNATPPYLRPKWSSGGVLARYGNILATYGMSWEDLRNWNDTKGWKKKVSDAIQAAFEKECKEAADRYNHQWLEYREPVKQPRIRPALRWGGELALAAIRMRSPRLRLLPSCKRTDHGLCRYCATGPENGAHLIICPALPLDLRSSRDSIIDAIVSQAGVPMSATRRGKLAIQDYVMHFSWPNQTDDLLKRLLVFCRNLINKYAAFKPTWETPNMEGYPVHRVRPVYRKPSENV